METRTHSRSVSHTLNRVMFGFACVGVIVSLAFYYQFTLSLFERASLGALKRLMASRTASESYLFEHAELNVKTLHAELIHRFNSIDPQEAERLFYERAAVGADGVYRVRPEYDDHTQLPTFYIQSEAQLSASLYARAVASYTLLAERGPALVPPYYSVYMDFVEKGLMVYSPFVNWGAGATAQTDNFDYPTMVGANPENNPLRELFWTPAYFGEEAQTWMVSVIKPLDWDGQWVGTVGHDVAIDQLLEQILSSAIEGSYDLILSSEGTLIAHPRFADQMIESKCDLDVSELSDPVLTRINELVGELTEFPAVLEDPENGKFYGVTRLEGPNWLLVTVYPQSLIRDRVLSSILVPSIALILLVIGALMLLRLLMQILVVRPLGHLDDAITSLSAGQDNIQIPIESEDEFGRLARSFEGLSGELRKRALSLQEAQNDWQQTFDTVLEYILIMDANQIIKQANHAYYSTFQVDPSEVVGVSRRDRVTEGNQSLYDSIMQRLFEKKEPLQFSAFADAFDLNIEVTLVPLLNQADEIVGVVEVGRNVTEQRVLEEQLRQSQKMDAVGQLAGGVAHDFNNLLQIILGYADNLRDERELAGEPIGEIEQILTAGSKAAALTQQLLAFSRQQVMQARVVDISDVIQSTLKLVTRVIESNVAIESPDLQQRVRVEVDANLIEQVLINLCLNARDAMPEGGMLSIGLDVVLTEGLPDGLTPNELGYVCISVRDTGHGVEPENQDRIFEPFFSTKDINKGTGLGLATAYGIIEQHQGAIKVFSVPGEGATFSVFLPITERTEQESVLSRESTEETSGGETILIAEDDESIRDLLTLMLNKGGYHVITATDGAEALTVFEQNRDKVELLLLDVMMPELSGDRVIREIRKMKSHIPCLIASGYSEDRGITDLISDPNTRFINKPFKMEVLLREVRQLLDGQIDGDE